MKLLSASTAFRVLLRLVAAASLIALVAVGAPLHSHHLVPTGDERIPQQAPCAACMTQASPGLVCELADEAPRFELVDLVLPDEPVAVAVALPTRSGRAPPAV